MREFLMCVYIYKGILKNHLKIRHITSWHEILRHCFFDLKVSLATDQFYNHHTATCAPVPSTHTRSFSHPFHHRHRYALLRRVNIASSETQTVSGERLGPGTHEAPGSPYPCHLPLPPVNSEPLLSLDAPPVNSNYRRGITAGSKEMLYFYICCR